MDFYTLFASPFLRLITKWKHPRTHNQIFSVVGWINRFFEQIGAAEFYNPLLAFLGQENSEPKPTYGHVTTVKTFEKRAHHSSGFYQRTIAYKRAVLLGKLLIGLKTGHQRAQCALDGVP